jgi:hypothetical protein
MPTAYARGQASQQDIPQPTPGGKPFLPQQTYANEQDNTLFGPTTRPNEHPATGAGLNGRISPDQSVYGAASVLQRAASLPGAPISLRSLAAQLTSILAGQ